MSDRRGYVPPDLARRLDHATSSFFERGMAKVIAGELEGRDPGSLRPDELDGLREHYDLEAGELDRCLSVLRRVGYGQRPPARPRREREHASRLEHRLAHVSGKLPRALALRMPTTPDTHRAGPVDGEDVYGRIRSSRTLRAGHLGIVAALCGLAKLPGRRQGDEVLATAGELAYLLQGKRRRSGPDLAWIYELLADHDQLELEAEVSPNAAGQDPSEQHRIPNAPIVSVRRRIDGRYVSLEEYAGLIGPDGRGTGRCGQDGTVAVELASWVWDVLEDEQRRPVMIDLTIWSHLRPLGQRLYAFLQGSARSPVSDSHYFYLGQRFLLTIGLCGTRLDRAATMVRHALTTLYHADARVQGFGQTRHANTTIPGFRVRTKRGERSRPSALARTHRAAPRRPRALRGLPRRRSHLQLGGVRRDELSADAVRELGEEEARRQALDVRKAILTAYGDAPPPNTDELPSPARPRRADNPRAGPAP